MGANITKKFNLSLVFFGQEKVKRQDIGFANNIIPLQLKVECIQENEA